MVDSTHRQRARRTAQRQLRIIGGPWRGTKISLSAARYPADAGSRARDTVQLAADAHRGRALPGSVRRLRRARPGGAVARRGRGACSSSSSAPPRAHCESCCATGRPAGARVVRRRVRSSYLAWPARPADASIWCSSIRPSAPARWRRAAAALDARLARGPTPASMSSTRAAKRCRRCRRLAGTARGHAGEVGYHLFAVRARS